MGNLCTIYNFLQWCISLSKTSNLFLFIIAENYRLTTSLNLVVCIFEKMSFLLRCQFTLRALALQ